MQDLSVSISSSLQEKSLIASYVVSLKLAKAQKCFSDGTLVKECAIEMAKAFGYDDAAEHFKTAALSRNTVRNRIVNTDRSIKEKLNNLVAQCRYYSLCIDESTDRTDISQLLIFIRVVMNDFSVQEELLALVPLLGTTDLDIFNAVKKCIDEIGGFHKCSAICTDGAPAMVGRGNGFVGQLRKNGVNCLTFHCIIHQEALCRNTIRMLSVMKDVTKITNIIRGGNRSLSHRKLKAFLEEVDAEYRDIPLHSEVRWLSAGKCLVRFFALRKELGEFLNKEGKERTISDMLTNINGFRSKLTLFKLQLAKENVYHFPSCSELKQEYKEVNFSRFASIIDEVSSESDLQEEVCNLQNDPFMLSRTETNAAIFEVMPQDRYPKLIDL
ncbi:PREDICTED: SCAN domain-containing protein 3-like [Trachymyrmex cornetzi]|uniref:SCAN domain-containing protein 3-like n=1 Tax=Trachymyrmex cornetzi TaxID=471704 RepID=UPI00084F793A|nr:PREDICTED: SCAN domain-containing protein 3-like [Trachymyrmex cornetzi]